MSNIIEDMEKLHVYASILKEEPSEEIATALAFPSPEDRQPDLQYINAVFVSSGFNLNLAYFLPSELIKARNTVVNKPLDLEHVQDDIVGHLYGSAFAYKDGSLFDPMELSDTVGMDVDKVSMDILTSSYVYKARFPELAQEVADGKYSVSMECYFKDFDIIVDNIIIPKVEAKKAGLVEAVNNVIQVVEGKTSKGAHKVGRVLRSMLFSGCGLVETPANPDSVIFETAAKLERATKNNETTSDYILDLTRVDSYMKAKQEREAIVVPVLGQNKKVNTEISSFGGVHTHEVNLEENHTFEEGSHCHTVNPEEVKGDYRIYFIEDGSHRHGFDTETGTLDRESGHKHKFYVEYEGGKGHKIRAYETSESKKPHTHELNGIEMDEFSDKEGTKGNIGYASLGGIHHHEIVLKDGTKLKTVTPQDILKLDSDSAAGKQNADNVIQKPEPEICVSFKRYIYDKGGDNPGEPSNADKTPGLVPQVESLPAPTGGGAGDTITQDDTIVHENWCALFETACTTPAGQATHPKCLRLVLGRTTKDAVSSFFGKMEEERSNKSLMKKIDALERLIEEASELKK